MAGKFVDVTLRLIDQMSSPLNRVGSNLSKSANQVTRAGKQIEKAGKNITKVGSDMTKAFTMPIVGAGVASIKLATDFEAGMSKVQSISGATEAEMDKLAEKAKEMGAKTKFSATESSEAFSYMAMAGWKTQDMLDGIEGIMYLAGATGEDLATTSDIVTDALTAFGMKANETQRFVNVLAQTASNSNTNVAMMGESFKYVAPVAGALGYNVEDISIALGLMANSGIKASSAGTSLRSLMTNLSKPTKQSQQAMDALGLSLTDSKGNMKDFNTLMTEMRGSFSKLSDAQKAQYAAMLAGKTGMSGLLAIVNSSDSDFNQLSDAIRNSTDACKNMYDVANNNLSGQITVLKSTVESLAISFGEKLTPYVEKLVKWVQNLATKFNGLSDSQKDMIVKVALVVASIGPAVMIFGKMVSTVGKVVKVVGAVGKAFKMFTSVVGLLTSPVGLVIVGLVALIAVIVLVVKNWEKIKETAVSVWEGIKGAWGSVVEWFSGIWDKVTEGLTSFWDKIKTGFKDAFEAVVGFVKTPINAVINLINGAIEGINKISVTVPDWIPNIGGQKFGFNIPTIPQLAVGTSNWNGGLAQISERGGEIVDLPQGSRVYPHDESVKKAYLDGARSGGVGSITIAKLADQIIVREDADIDKIAQALADKLEKCSQNLGGGEIGYIY